MNYYTIPPPPDLAMYVRLFWVLESSEPYCHRSLADGCAEMIFHYKGEFRELTEKDTFIPSFVNGLQGPSQQYRRFTTDNGFGIFGVYLYPFALPLLFGVPSNEVADEMIELEDLSAKDGEELGSKMLAASGNEERVRIITRFFRQCARQKKFLDTACLSVIRQMIHADTLFTVDQLAKASFLSFRQFERKFKQLSGFSPKRYSRILRFQMATRYYGCKEKSLTKIAHACGYYDQAHFIHEFKQFSGYHPKSYFFGDPEGVAWKESNQP